MKIIKHTLILLSITLISNKVIAQSEDCSGVIGGLAMIDDCGDCQSALVYDFVQHIVTGPALTSDVELGPTEMLVMPNDPSNPYWNASCMSTPGCMDPTATNFNWMATEDDGSCEYALPEDCSGVIGGLAMIDDCGDCQSALVYDFVQHIVTGPALTSDVELGPTEMLVMPNDPSNPYWNASCMSTPGCMDPTATNFNWMATEDDGSCEYALPEDCSGVIGGLAMIDDCGDCQSALVYDFVQHIVTGPALTSDVELGPTEMLVMPNDPSNPYWNASCMSTPGCMDPTATNFNWMATEDDGSCEYALPEDCSGVIGGLAMIDDCGDCQSALVYDFVQHIVTGPALTSDVELGPTEMLVMPNDPSNPYWNASCMSTPGCMDPTATNFNWMATEDDGSCEYALPEDCQNINLNSGWSIFSTYVTNTNMNLENLFSSVAGEVIIAKNYLGAAYLPDWNFNAIGEISTSQGYNIKTTNNLTIEICGIYNLPEENPIELPGGWFSIGYLRLEPSPVNLVVNDIVDDIIILKDYLGNAFLPEFDFNGIGNLNPGQGYQIKTEGIATLTYLSNDQEYRLNHLEVIENNVSHYAKLAATGNNMTVVIEDAAWDILPTEGAEIAAFDKYGNMVGSAVYSSPVTVVTVWGDDATTTSKDGMLVSESVSFKVWNNNEVSDFTVAKWIEGSSSYQVNGISVASTIETNNVITEIKATERVLVKVINVLGQEVNLDDQPFKGTVLFNIYDDGSVEQFVN